MFIGNYKVIENISDLPKIGDTHKYYNNAVVVSVAQIFAVNTKNHTVIAPDSATYLNFKVSYTEDMKNYDVDEGETFYFLYTISKENFIKGLKQ